MDPSPLECDVCKNTFDDDHGPRMLPCSHTFCHNCLNRIIQNLNKTCPVCRKKFKASSAEDIMLNRNLLQAAKLFSPFHNLKSSSNAPLADIGGYIQDFRGSYTVRILSDCKKIESRVSEVIVILKRKKARLLDLRKDIMKFTQIMQEIMASSEDSMNKEGIPEYMNLMEELMATNENALNVVKKIIKHLMMWSKKILPKRGKIGKFDDKLKVAKNCAAGGAVMDEGKKDFEEIQEIMKEIKDFLAEKERERKDMDQVISRTELKLVNIAEEMDKRTKEAYFVNTKVDDLVSLCGDPSNETTEGREIVALQIFEGTQKVSRVKIGSHNQIFVSHLREADVPQNSLVLKHECLMQRSSNQKMFLDLNLDENLIARIVIKITREGNKALNILHMCAGDLGPSYVNSRVSHIWRKRDCIYIGEYIRDGEVSKEPVLSGVDWALEKEREIYEETPYKAGDVRGTISYDYASFLCIVTRDNPSYRSKNSFGVVEEGLDVLRDIISRYRKKDILRIRISDCGFIFSL